MVANDGVVKHGRVVPEAEVAAAYLDVLTPAGWR
jgi:hypothetical protein